MTKQLDALDLVEVAYDPGLDDQAWLKGLAGTAAAALGVGGVGLAVRFDAADPVRPQIHGVAFEGLRVEDFLPLMGGVSTTEEGQDAFAAIHAGPRVSTMRTTLGDALDRSPLYRALIEPMGFHDVAYINAGDLGGAACTVALPLPRASAGAFATSARGTLQRVEAHLTAAVRLRARGPAASAGDEEAVMDTSGRVVHAEGRAKGPGTRAALRQAALCALRARQDVRGESADDALAMWRTLVTCRWSLVDRFESDGRRYLIARANEPPTAARGNLTDRQYQVASMAALGHSNKMIGYALGLSAATVSEHLSRACERLGVRSRAELAQRVVALLSRSAPSK